MARKANADLPAMPTDGSRQSGMTKREMIAMHIMAATAHDNADNSKPEHFSYAAQMAVEMTDALLFELDKPR